MKIDTMLSEFNTTYRKELELFKKENKSKNKKHTFSSLRLLKGKIKAQSLIHKLINFNYF